MSFRKVAIFAALCAVALMGIASSASAATFLRTDPGGTLLQHAKIHATLKAGTHVTLTSSSGNITCASSTFVADVGASGTASVTYTLTQLTFTNCTDTIALVDFSSCHLASTSVATFITATGTGGTLFFGGVPVQCYHNIGSCTFTTNAGQSGVETNSSNQIAFTGIGAAGSGFGCPSTGSFSETYNPVTQAGTTNTVTITTS